MGCRELSGGDKSCEVRGVSLLPLFPGLWYELLSVGGGPIVLGLYSYSPQNESHIRAPARPRSEARGAWCLRMICIGRRLYML